MKEGLHMKGGGGGGDGGSACVQRPGIPLQSTLFIAALDSSRVTLRRSSFTCHHR